MTALLASVASIDEIDAAVSGGADIIDLKDPARGALGAWGIADIHGAVARLRGIRPVSATVGDLPMEPNLIADAARSVASAGVDFVKVGLFPGANCRACIAALADVAADARIVAVLFADREPDFALLPSLRDARFHGVMLDTADKSGGSLRDCISAQTLSRFVAAGRALGLYVGLSGSLMPHDIPPLSLLGPDFLGFRRALCGTEGRTGKIDLDCVAGVREALDAAAARAQTPAAKQATATAGAQTLAQ